MTLLPIVARELRVTARKRSTYWIRFAAAVLALAICSWSFLFFTNMGMANMAGQMLFGGLTGLAWLYAVIGGIFKTADTLSEEKRDGTLGLLFLTDLKGYDIVLGKIVAASVNWFFGLLALFPILALALLMGGVAPGEFWRKILALANLLFYSLALGMFISSFMRNERRAAGLTIAMLALLLWFPSETAQELQKLTGSPDRSPWLVFPDVSQPLHYAQDYPYGRTPHYYWWSLGISHAIGWIYLLLASLIVPHTWQQQAGRVSRWQEQAEQFTYGKNSARRKRFRERALSWNPFYWVAARARWQSLMLLLVLVAVLGCFLISLIYEPKSWTSEWTYLWPAFVLQCVIKVWIAMGACRRFVEDRRSGALELILSTPLTPDEILRGQWRALFKQFALPVCCVLFADVGLMCIGLIVPQQSAMIGGVKEEYLFLMMMAAQIIVFIADVFALAWLSMWRGMKARHSYTAALWCIVQVLALPWFVFYLGMTVFMMLVILPQVTWAGRTGVASATLSKWMEWMPFILTGIWFVGSMAVAILSGWWGRRCLRKYFRYQATASYQPLKPIWSPRGKPSTV